MTRNSLMHRTALVIGLITLCALALTGCQTPAEAPPTPPKEASSPPPGGMAPQSGTGVTEMTPSGMGTRTLGGK